MEKSQEFAYFLYEKIKEFNNEHSIHHLEARKEGAVKPIQIIVTDENEKWIGGIDAEVYWDWMEIANFWIKEEYRGKGLGGLILEKAENMAKTLGAKKALLTTFDFQARTFYESKGYQIVGEIKDYPPGSSYFTKFVS